jgi:hypothetical protein
MVPMPRPAPAVAFPPIPTRISFSEELSSMGAAHMAPTLFTASNQETPQPVRFRIAVSPDGEVRHCFPLNSSGDPALDQQARHQVVLARFDSTGANGPNSSDQPDVWGIATVEWGNDVTRPTAVGSSSAP